MGFEELLGGDGIALIEWSGRGKEYLPERALEITIRSLGGDDREILFRTLGGFDFEEDWVL